MTTDNFGIGLNVATTVLDNPFEIYVSLTGDQVALTNIRIIYENETTDEDEEKAAD